MTHSDNLQQAYKTFTHALDQLDRTACLMWAKQILEQGDIPLIQLYEHILAPSLNLIASNEIEQQIPIWEEHIRSGIVRSVIELASPYVLFELAKSGVEPLSQQALVLCLEEEYHELGARIAADYLILLGFRVHFIGANTPKSEIFNALQLLSPKLLVISVTNYYHLTTLQHLILEIKADTSLSPYIAVGGYAVENTPHIHDIIHPDFFVCSFQDYIKLKEAIL